MCPISFFEKNDIIFNQNDACSSAYLIVAGQVTVTIHTPGIYQTSSPIL